MKFSATQLQAGDFHMRIRNTLADTGPPSGLLEVEMTESAAIAAFARTTAVLVELRRRGIGVAIDDFGVGYSSLSYLAELPATCIKIDRAFTQGTDGQARRSGPLHQICRRGHAMQMSVTVEGVEPLDIAAWLRTVGCDAVQGFAFSRPLAAAPVDAVRGNPGSRPTA